MQTSINGLEQEHSDPYQRSRGSRLDQDRLWHAKSIDPSTFEKLLTIAGGEVVSNF
jgi:hypothetical protein